MITASQITFSNKMKLLGLNITLLVACSYTTTLAFTPSTSISSTHITNRNTPSLLYSTEIDSQPSDVEQDETDSLLTNQIRQEVIYTAQSLAESSLTGIFLTSPSDIRKLESVVTKLEASAPKSFSERERELCLGDWELLCTARGAKMVSRNRDSLVPNLQFKTPASFTQIQDSIRKSFSVLQRIRSTPNDDTTSSSSSNTINRIDHVIEYTPLKTLENILPQDNALFQSIRTWNVNPLDVSKSKITLIHKANVESLEPVFRTKLSLKSVVVNVAGTSQYLDPKGADILGLNLPSLGDFTNAGTFDTTYVDETIRISRGKLGLLDDLRVFIRKDISKTNFEEMMEEEYERLRELENDDDYDDSTEEEYDSKVGKKLKKVKGAMDTVASKIEKMDRNVRSTVVKDVENVNKAMQDAVKDIEGKIVDDLKDIGKAMEDVKDVIVGDDIEKKEEVKEEDEKEEE
jgi:hypothetical protein